MLTVIRNYCNARKHGDLHALAHQYLVAGLKAEAVIWLFLPLRLPLALLSFALDLLERFFWSMRRMLNRVLNADWWPGFRLVEERDRLSEKLWWAYAPYRKGRGNG